MEALILSYRKFYSYFFSFLFFFLFFGKDFANSKPPETALVIEHKLNIDRKRHKSLNYTAFHFNNIHFLSSDSTSFEQKKQTTNLTTLGFDLKHSLSFFRYWKSYLDLTAFRSFAERKNYIHGREMYFVSEWHNFDVSIGRKQYLWSRGDRLWTQGLWQPRFSWNALKKEEQGLVGLFIDNFFLNDTFSFMAFYSPLFIPETGPSFKLEDGKFISKNPWFISYQEAVNIRGFSNQTASLEIKYNLLDFEKKDILWNHGAGLNTGIQFGKGRFFSLSYAYKPMSRLTEAIGKPRLDLNAEKARLFIDLAPRMSYHHLLTLDVGKEATQSYNEWNYWVSLNYEKPTNQSVLGNENILANGQKKFIKESLFGTFYLSYDWRKGLRDFTQFYLSYGKLFRGGIESEGEFFLSQVEKQFLNPYLYKDVFQFGVKRPSLNVFGYSLSSALQVLYDRIYDGIMFEADFYFHLPSNWLLNVNSKIVDVFGEVQGLPFFYRYRFNDYLKMGLKYIF